MIIVDLSEPDQLETGSNKQKEEKIEPPVTPKEVVENWIMFVRERARSQTRPGPAMDFSPETPTDD